MHPSWILVFFFISGYGAVQLLMSQKLKIKLIEDTDLNVTSLASPTSTGHEVIALDYHLARGEVYYTDRAGQIYRSWLRADDRARTPTLIAEVALSDGIAVDWIHDNLYWTDVGRKTLEVATLDGLSRKVLLNKTSGIDGPRAIVVDPSKGLLFWSDWGDNPRVESSGLDGKKVKTIVFSSNVRWPNGLTLDSTHSKLYILDGFLSTILSCNYDGSDLKVLSRSSDNIKRGFGLTFYANTLYWSSWHARSLFKMNITNLQTKTLLRQTELQEELDKMMEVKAVHTSIQPKPSTQDPCKTANCSHSCLLGRDLTPTCFCPFGYKLSSDGKTCTEEGYLIISLRKIIRRYTTDGDEDDTFVHSTKAAISISYHLEKGIVFWSDIEEHRIYRAYLDQFHNKTVVASPVTCDGLAVDWIHDVLYWTDTHFNTIEAAELDGSKHMIIFNTDLDEPRDIALDPFEGLMFWTDWGATPKIERSTLDGLERKIIIDDDQILPNGITIDIPFKTIYYVDGKIGTIYSSSYDGSDKKIVIPPQKITLHLFAITLLKDELYWTDWKTMTLYKSPKDGTTVPRRLVQSFYLELMPNGVRAVHSSLQETKENPCDKVDCKNLCLGTKYHIAHCMGEDTPDDSLDHPELIINVFNDSTDISLAKNVTPVTVVIVVKCLGRVGCKEDIRCSNQKIKPYIFDHKNNFHIANLLPGSHYKIDFISEKLIKFFNIITKVTDPPEIPKITSIEKEGKKVTVKWDPVDTCVPGFSSYHYKLYKTAVGNDIVQEGSTNLTQVTFDNLEVEVSYNVKVYTYDSNHSSSMTFNVQRDVPPECHYQNLLCDGKEDCPDGSDEDEKQCAAIEYVVVYKISESEVYFRVEVTNGTKNQLDKFVGRYSSGKSDITEQFDRTAEACVMWPESYCFHVSSLQSNTVYDFKISASLKNGKVGNKFIVSAITKEEAPGPPENVRVINHNATYSICQWNHPNQSNGIIKSFIINIEQTKTYDEDKCCQTFPVLEKPVAEEKTIYETVVPGLTPASSYAISVAAKKIYVWTSAVITFDTPPPPMEVMRKPSVEVASQSPLSWQLQKELGELPLYHNLIRSYMLLLLPPENEPLNEASTKEPDAIKELLQSKFGGRFVVLWNKKVEEMTGLQSPIKVESLPTDKQFRFAWVQVAQYNNAYSIDFLESDPFITS